MVTQFKRKSRLFLGAAAAAIMVMQAPAAFAQTEDLEARIAALEAMISDLRAEVAASRANEAQTTARVEMIEARVEEAPAAPAASSAAPGFMSGNTRIDIGGLLDVDYHITDFSDGDVAPTSIVRDFYIPGATPIGGTGDGEPDNDFTAQASRFYFTSSTPTDHGDVTTRIEMDFLGSLSGNERVSNSYNPRLRHAWLQYGNWRMGQDWSTFQNTSSIPESASFLVGSDGMIFVRQPQLRYTNGNWQIALENPDTTVTPNGGGARIDGGDGAIPDLIVRYNARGDFGNLSVSGLARNLTYEGPGADGNAFGWGVSVAGRLNITDMSDLRVSATVGEGLGRYIGLNSANGAVIDANGDLEAIGSLGGMIAYRQMLDDNQRINLGYSFLDVDNDVALTGTGATTSTYSGFANYLVTLAPGITVGAELLYGERELENGQSGSISRATFSTKYAF